MNEAQNQTAGQPLAVRAKQAAKLLAVSEKTLWARTNAGRIPHVKAGGVVLYRTAALEQWLIEQEQGT